MEKEEFHSFEVDARIVSDLIYRQNGTISTAMRELVMNAFDANSEKVEISLSSEGFEIKDNGDGFEDEAAIMRNFKRFGTPHVEGDAVYGRFRIGRGQIMAFAKTTWHSKNYQMITDAAAGAGFTFKKDAEPYNGCHVFGSFYAPLSLYELNHSIDDLTAFVRYSPWPVFINQVQVNVNEDDIAWNYEDEKMKIIFSPKGRYGIRLYSLGIFVKELQMYQYGISADVVTKQALQLNMARNEISHNDPLWRHVHNVLRAELRKKQLSKNRMTESERYALIDQFLNGEVSFFEILKLPLLKDVRGKLSSFEKELAKKRPWTLCEDVDSSLGDKVSIQGNAFVISRSELDIWCVTTIKRLIVFCVNNMAKGRLDNRFDYLCQLLSEIEVVHFSDISRGVCNQYELIPLANLTAIEKAQRNALQYVVGNMCKRLGKLHRELINKRKLYIGDGHAVAWTDSSTYIAVNRKTLSLFNNGIQGITQLVAILLHELTHHDGSAQINDHDMAFYERFHDSLISPSIRKDVFGNAISSLRNQYETELENANLPFPKWMVNEETPIVISLLGSAPTPLLAWFLKLIDFPIVRGRGKINIHVRGRKLSNLRELVNKRIDAMLKKHGLEVVRLKDFGHFPYDERFDKYSEARIPMIKSMFEKEGIAAPSLALQILSGSLRSQNVRVSRFSDCHFGGLSFLIEDDAFGVKSIHKEYSCKAKIIAGKDFLYTNNFRGDLSYHFMTAESFAESFVNGGQKIRFEHYKEIFEEIVNGITNQAEREKFMEEVFSDTMKNFLNTPNKKV